MSRNPAISILANPTTIYAQDHPAKKLRIIVRRCVPKHALRIMENPMMEALGDYRWTSDLILATWRMAETGEVPPGEYGLEYDCGNSGGGFDRLQVSSFPNGPPWTP